MTERLKSSGIKWYFEHIQKCGCDTEGNVFSINAGSKCSIGEAIYHFSTAHAKDSYKLFNEVVTGKTNKGKLCNQVMQAMQ